MLGGRSQSKSSDQGELVKNYFDGQSSVLAWFLIISGVLSLPLVLGLAPLAIGTFLLLRRKRLQSDAQIDALADEYFAAHDFIGRGLRLAGSPKLVREPTIIRGEGGGILSDGVYSGERWGDDGLWRRTPLAATVIMCTSEQIIVYQTGLDLTTGNRVNERVVEAFYQDVISVGMNSQSITYDFDAMLKNISKTSFDAKQVNKGLSRRKMRRILSKLKEKYEAHMVGETAQIERVKTYLIELSDGDKISISVRDGRASKIANDMDDASQGDVTAQSMFALRAFVREQKQRLLQRYATPGSGPLV